MNIQEIMSIVSIVIGWISMGCVCAYAIPQFINILKTKNTSSMALSTYICFCICSSLMIAWNIGNVFKLNEDTGSALTATWCVLTLLPAITLNLLNTSLNLISLFIKLRHLKLCKKLKVNEFELSQILLSNQLKKNKQSTKGRK